MNCSITRLITYTVQFSVDTQEMAEIVSFPQLRNEPQDAGPSPADAYKAMGRDSPAGRALFALYNGDSKGKSAGDQFHAKNRERHQARVANGWTPPPKEPTRAQVERPQVNYPKFGREKHAKEVPVRHIPHRKPGQQIMAEMDAEKQVMRAHRPQPKGPLLDDKEKDRCATLMQYRGKVPQITAEERAAAALARGAREPVTERQELTRLFDSVVQEIEERKQFLESMQAAGKLTREMQHQLRCEIQQRVVDLEKLDRIINEREDTARASAGLPPR